MKPFTWFIGSPEEQARAQRFNERLFARLDDEMELQMAERWNSHDRFQYTSGLFSHSTNHKPPVPTSEIRARIAAERAWLEQEHRELTALLERNRTGRPE